MDPGSAREEAERLVATLLAAVRLAGGTAGSGAGSWGPLGGIVSSVLGHSGGGRSGAGSPVGGGFATGTAECCVCPVCRGIAALRDPSPEFAERLATGAGDFAAGVASLLRAFASAKAPTAAAADGADGQVWRETTRTGHDSQPAPGQDVWSAATREESTADPAAVGPPADDAGPDEPGPPRPVVPASRAPASVGEDVAGDGA
jgi:hypothetical protein